MPTAAEILLDQGRQEGLQAGLQEGRQEGLQEGHQEGLIDAIGTLLVDRFGSAGKALIPRLSTISDLDRLHAILRTTARAESIAEVEQTLR